MDGSAANEKAISSSVTPSSKTSKKMNSEDKERVLRVKAEYEGRQKIKNPFIVMLSSSIPPKTFASA
ncbi:MAG: hypothetical protein HQL63_03485 [Magnetococcales bacterium]|nr:hypothetical protein [Magnetococcales bacterium]MBF0321731.1 hypothetical protein [Magnetococcales bacterium]